MNLLKSISNEKRYAVEFQLGRKLRSTEHALGINTPPVPALLDKDGEVREPARPGRAQATREQKQAHAKFLESLKPVETTADYYEREFVKKTSGKQTPAEKRAETLASMREAEKPAAPENPRIQKYHRFFEEIGHNVYYTEEQYMHLERLRAALEAGNDAAFDAQALSLSTSIKEMIETQKQESQKKADEIRKQAEKLIEDIKRQSEVFGLEPKKVDAITYDEQGRVVIPGGLPAGMTVDQWVAERERQALAMELTNAE